MKPKTTEPTIPAAQAAKKIGVSLCTIYRRIKDGSLRACRIGRGFQVALSDLEKMATPRNFAEA